ncbi:MAG: hypothetical protein AB1626_02455 [Candidatus Micrarchaeota archaeon]
MEPQRKPRIVSVTPPAVQPAPPQPTAPQPPQPPAPPRVTEDNPLVKAMQEEALRDLRPQTPAPAAPRVIAPSQPPSAPAPVARKLSDAELRQKIAADQIGRQSTLSSRLSAFFGGLFKKKPREGLANV